MMYGLGLLGQSERLVLRRLSPATQRLIYDELQSDPSTADEIMELLREPDPERAIARSISEEVVKTISSGMSGYGLGRMPKWKSFKKSVSHVAAKAQENVSDAAKKAQEIVKKVAPYSSLPVALLTKTKTGQAIVQRAKVAAKKYGPTAVVLGATILMAIPGGQPFGLAIIAIAQARQAVMAAKKRAQEAADAASADADALNAQAAEIARQYAADVEVFYQENQKFMENAGYPRDKWDALSPEEKDAVIVKLFGAVDAVGNDVIEGTSDAGETVESGVDWSQQPDIIEPGPSGTQAPIDTGGVTYELVVEGKTVFTTEKGLDAITAVLGSYANSGDRFEILAGGRSTGLKVMTAAGPISVPPDQEAGVRGATPDQMRGFVAQAETSAGVQKPKGGFPVWLLAIPAAAIAVTR